MATTINCPKCKAEIESDSYFCDQCGAELFICPDCQVLGKGKRCTRCGKELVSVRELMSESTVKRIEPVMPRSESTIGKTISTGKTIRPKIPPKVLPVRLVCTNPSLRLALVDGVVIGRRHGGYAQVFLPHTYISGKHARLQKGEDGKWEVIDLESTNGTFLNGDQLPPNKPVMFQVGDMLRFANIEFKVE
ncbi:MAG: FHA domain-containing protein [Prevotellaceae bacterium]|nr:FHA domain-containing protein [Prevotellaceae bacterium]